MAGYARHLGVNAEILRRSDAEGDPAIVRERIAQADVVAAAIPDDRIAAWRSQWKDAIGRRLAIHFSGARNFEGMASYHPLYSFPKEPLAADVMASIAIIRDRGAPPFASIFSGAPNPDYEIEPEGRALYHAIAVLSGNFAAHLWNESATVLAARFGIEPATALGAYFSGLADRFRERPFDSLTGPVIRKDAATIAANLAALDAEPRLKALYEAFLESAWPDRRR
ncbi:MAG: DUF2520 domain-containing protein [Parvularculaceae bacterium]|nr:DUF2520 domain-containing protein [Parvularculaceae bacterium]